MTNLEDDPEASVYNREFKAAGDKDVNDRLELSGNACQFMSHIYHFLHP